MCCRDTLLQGVGAGHSHAAMGVSLRWGTAPPLFTVLQGNPSKPACVCGSHMQRVYRRVRNFHIDTSLIRIITCLEGWEKKIIAFWTFGTLIKYGPNQAKQKVRKVGLGQARIWTSMIRIPCKGSRFFTVAVVEPLFSGKFSWAI